jgi:radical SAM superfamily enzyme YgiQ (UPF0313 family)
VFDYFDYITLDDGERPLLALLEHLAGQRGKSRLVRTCAKATPKRPVRYINLAEPDIPFAEVGTPPGTACRWTLPVDPRHAQPDAPAVVRRALEQAHRGPRLLLEEVQLLRREPRLHRPLRRHAAPSCWSTASRPSSPRPARPASTSSTKPRRPRCSRRWPTSCPPQPGDLVVGQHPLREILHPELCQQLADSGCIAISGGLEVASDRLLKLMKKGVSVDRWPASPRASTPASWCTPT